MNATFAVEAGVTYRIAVDGAFDSRLGEAATGSFDVAGFMQLPFKPALEAASSSPSKSTADKRLPKTTVRRRFLKRRGIWLFRLRSNERGSTFRCKLDKRRFRRCRSSLRLRHLKPGRHVLRVFAVAPLCRVLGHIGSKRDTGAPTGESRVRIASAIWRGSSFTCPNERRSTS